MTAPADSAQALPLSPIDAQKISGEMVASEVYANVGSLMEYCISRVFEGDDDNPISEDDLDFRVDPSEWDAHRCHEFIKDELDATWEGVTGEKWELGERESALEAARERIRAWAGEADDYDEHDNPLPNEREARIEKYYDADVDLWDASLLHAFISEEMNEDWEDITGYAIDATVADRDEDDFDHENELEAARDYIRENAEQREIYEWWAISDWLGRKLKERDHFVLDVGQLTVWGREGSGQAIKMDGDIMEIALELHRRRNGE